MRQIEPEVSGVVGVIQTIGVCGARDVVGAHLDRATNVLWHGAAKVWRVGLGVGEPGFKQVCDLGTVNVWINRKRKHIVVQIGSIVIARKEQPRCGILPHEEGRLWTGTDTGEVRSSLIDSSLGPFRRCYIVSHIHCYRTVTSTSK